MNIYKNKCIKMKVESRIYNNPEISLRAITEGEDKILEGYAALYNVESRLLYENGKKFIEIINKGAFNDVLNNDVYLTFNHSQDSILARTINKSLILKEDDKGLFFRAILNNTSIANDLYEMVSRGDVVENSFAFTVDEGQKWERNAEGIPLRRISRISNLYDVSVVTKAAYPQTEVYARGFEEYIKEQEPVKIIMEPYEDEARILKLKNNIK